MTTNTNTSLDFSAVETFEMEANRGRREFTSLVQNPDGGWEFRSIGTLERVTADGLRGQEVVFRSELNGKSYELGNFRQVGVLDHGPLFRPFLADGWQVKSHKTLRGGARIATELVHPDFVIDDTITWDLTSRGGHLVEQEKPSMHPSVLILADVRKGNQVDMTAGLHRLVCTNGLVAKVLDLGDLQFSHVLSADAATLKVSNFSQELLENQRWNDLRYTEYHGSSIRTVAEWLSVPSAVPSLVRPALETIGLWNSARREELAALLSQIDDGFTVVDLLNAITNVDQGIRTQWNLDRFATSMRDLVELAQWVGPRG